MAPRTGARRRRGVGGGGRRRTAALVVGRDGDGDDAAVGSDTRLGEAEAVAERVWNDVTELDDARVVIDESGGLIQRVPPGRRP
ncbi:MAG: hypothetical protein ACRD07_18000 [Acidimicrobiales bacterium]